MGKRLLVIGATGFVGRAVIDKALSEGHHVHSTRIRVEAGPGVDSPVNDWPKHFSETYKALVQAFADAEVVINAAGVADPNAPASAELTAANVVLPVLAAQAARERGIPRLVHVSSAAVQGRQDPLDEEAAWRPFSPYSQSKADAEKLLLRMHENYKQNLVIYRATSVHGPDRPLTKRFAAAARQRFVPVCLRGAVPLPVALWRNLGGGIVHAASASDVKGIVCQPSEGVTAAELWRAFNPDVRLVSLPLAATKAGLAAFRGLGRVKPSLEANIRRLELLLLGQHIEATKLVHSGYRPTAGPEAWRELGHIATKGIVASDGLL